MPAPVKALMARAGRASSIERRDGWIMYQPGAVVSGRLRQRTATLLQNVTGHASLVTIGLVSVQPRWYDAISGANQNPRTIDTIWR